MLNYKITRFGMDISQLHTDRTMHLQRTLVQFMISNFPNKNSHKVLNTMCTGYHLLLPEKTFDYQFFKHS